MPSVPPRPPTADKELHAHFPYIRDARHRGDVVTTTTTLATQYRLNNPKINNEFLRNITGISDVKVPCQISSNIEMGSCDIPPTLEKGKHGFEIFLTFNLLAIAPSLRLEVHFIKADGVSPYLVLVLEFPFNKRSGKQLRDFRYCANTATRNADIYFGSTGATSEGFTLISSVQDQFGEDERRAVGILRRLSLESEEIKIHLLLKIQDISPANMANFQKIVSRLPGGQGHLLPSIGISEFSNYPIDDLATMRQPHKLMTMNPPNLMTPLHCPSTFGSIKHFAVELLFGASMLQLEGQTLLQEFAEISDHKVALYELKGIPIFAMQFGTPIAGPLKDALRLPNELEIKITLADFNEEEEEQYTAVRDAYLQGLPEHDAYFVITSHDLRCFSGMVSARACIPKYYRVSGMIPHQDSFLLKSLTSAVHSLKDPKHHRFHPIALGQSFDSLKPNNITSQFGVSASVAANAWTWLQTYKPWNEEQRRLILQLKYAKGGMSLATGTAGTGKTTVQMAMAVYFVKMGGRAACFATSNSNVATQAEAVCELVEAISGSDIRVIRVVSASRGIGSKHISATQALAKKVGHSGGTVSTIYGLRFMQAGQNMDNLEDWAHTVEACMLEEAEKAQLVHMFRYENKAGSRHVDAWDEFRRYLKLSLADAFWENKNKAEVKRYVTAFEACKGHLIALSDIIMTTNGNAQCAELVDYWAKAEELYGVRKISRLGVFIDEVGKEQEIHIWNAMLSKGLPRVPDFVMLLGDPKQLKPVNTSLTKDLQCNPFATRASISMLERLMGLSFQHIHLDVQQRMSPFLWKFPSLEFYGSAHRSAPGLERSLEDVEPGLKVVLDNVIASSYDVAQEGADYIASATDEQTRLHYLDFGVQRVACGGSNESSRAIPGHIKAVFDLVIPALQMHFGNRLYREVIIIAAYGYAVGCYQKKLYNLQQSQGLSPSHYPRIMTIDSAQGQEAKMVIADNSMQHHDRMGTVILKKNIPFNPESR